MTNAFDELHEHDSTPTIPITDVQKVRMSELANQLNTAMTQAYVEANVINKLLDLVKELVPLLTGAK